MQKLLTNIKEGCAQAYSALKNYFSWRGFALILYSLLALASLAVAILSFCSLIGSPIGGISLVIFKHAIYNLIALASLTGGCAVISAVMFLIKDKIFSDKKEPIKSLPSNPMFNDVTIKAQAGETLINFQQLNINIFNLEQPQQSKSNLKGLQLTLSSLIETEVLPLFLRINNYLYGTNNQNSFLLDIEGLKENSQQFTAQDFDDLRIQLKEHIDAYQGSMAILSGSDTELSRFSNTYYLQKLQHYSTPGMVRELCRCLSEYRFQKLDLTEYEFQARDLTDENEKGMDHLDKIVAGLIKELPAFPGCTEVILPQDYVKGHSVRARDIAKLNKYQEIKGQWFGRFQALIKQQSEILRKLKAEINQLEQVDEGARASLAESIKNRRVEFIRHYQEFITLKCPQLARVVEGERQKTINLFILFKEELMQAIARLRVENQALINPERALIIYPGDPVAASVNRFLSRDKTIAEQVLEWARKFSFAMPWESAQRQSAGTVSVKKSTQEETISVMKSQCAKIILSKMQWNERIDWEKREIKELSVSQMGTKYRQNILLYHTDKVQENVKALVGSLWQEKSDKDKQQLEAGVMKIFDAITGCMSESWSIYQELSQTNNLAGTHLENLRQRAEQANTRYQRAEDALECYQLLKEIKCKCIEMLAPEQIVAKQEELLLPTQQQLEERYQQSKKLYMPDGTLRQEETKQILNGLCKNKPKEHTALAHELAHIYNTIASSINSAWELHQSIQRIKDVSKLNIEELKKTQKQLKGLSTQTQAALSLRNDYKLQTLRNQAEEERRAKEEEREAKVKAEERAGKADLAKEEAEKLAAAALAEAEELKKKIALLEQQQLQGTQSQTQNPSPIQEQIQTGAASQSSTGSILGTTSQYLNSLSPVNKVTEQVIEGKQLSMEQKTPV